MFPSIKNRMRYEPTRAALFWVPLSGFDVRMFCGSCSSSAILSFIRLCVVLSSELKYLSALLAIWDSSLDVGDFDGRSTMQLC